LFSFITPTFGDLLLQAVLNRVFELWVEIKILFGERKSLRNKNFCENILLEHWLTW